MGNPDAHPDDLGENFRPLPDAIRTKSTKFQNIPVGLSGHLLDNIAQPDVPSGPDSLVVAVINLCWRVQVRILIVYFFFQSVSKALSM